MWRFAIITILDWFYWLSNPKLSEWSLMHIILSCNLYSKHRINIKWKDAFEKGVETIRTKCHLIKWIHRGFTVGGHRNHIKQIWGMEPIWLMDVGYDIVLEGNATRRPSDATAPQTSTNHYCRIIEHTWSDPGGRHARERKKTTSLWIMMTVTLVIYHHPERRWLG